MRHGKVFRILHKLKNKPVKYNTLQNKEKVVCKQRITSCLRKSRFIASFLVFVRKVRFFELQRTIHHQRLEECQKWTKSESCCSWCCYCRRWCYWCCRRSQMATVHFRSTCPSVAKLHTPKIMETNNTNCSRIAIIAIWECDAHFE